MLSVCFGTPSLTHSVSAEYLRSHTETLMKLALRGVSPHYIMRCGDQFVGKVRSIIAWEFVTETDADSLFFLDDDLGWPADKALEFLERDEPILCGCYPKKSDVEDWTGTLCADGDSLVERDGLVRLISGPAGFLRIRREVLTALMSQAPLFFDVEKDGSKRQYPMIFSPGIGPDGMWWTEDHSFCRNAEAAGFETWCDPDIQFSHRGNKAWSGRMSDVLPTFRERAREAHLATIQPANQEAA